MKNLLLYILLAVVTSLAACDDPIFSKCKSGYHFEMEYRLNFYLRDKQTNNNLLQLGNHRYARGNVALYSEDLEKVRGPILENEGNFSYAFLFYPSRAEEPIGVPISHTYYLFLEKSDYDTLNIAYTIGINKCDEKILTQWKVSYNDSVYFDLINPSSGKTVYFLK